MLRSRQDGVSWYCPDGRGAPVRGAEAIAAMEPRHRLSPELTAAFVNGTIVLLTPLALAAVIVIAASFGPGPSGVDGSTLGRKIVVRVLGLMVLLTSASPFAVI